MRHRKVVTHGSARTGTDRTAIPPTQDCTDGGPCGTTGMDAASDGDWPGVQQDARRLASGQRVHPLRDELEPLVVAIQGVRRLIDDGKLPEASWQAIWELIGELSAMSGGSGEKLTRRERQVLQLAAEGLQHRAIGQRLMIERDTVETYLKKVRQKLDVRSTLAAVAAARRQGWIR